MPSTVSRCPIFIYHGADSLHSDNVVASRFQTRLQPIVEIPPSFSTDTCTPALPRRRGSSKMLNPLTTVPVLPTLQKDTAVAGCLFASLGPLGVVVCVVEPLASSDSGDNSPEDDKHNSSSRRSRADAIQLAFVPGMMHLGRDGGSQYVTG